MCGLPLLHYPYGNMRGWMGGGGGEGVNKKIGVYS